MTIEFKQEYSQYLLQVPKLAKNTEEQYRSYLANLSKWAKIDITLHNALSSTGPLIRQRLEAKVDEIKGGVKTIGNWCIAWRHYEDFARWRLEKDAQHIVNEEKDPNDGEEARRRIWVSILQRQGQPEFRKKLLQAYDFQCAVTGCRDIYVLEAAHVRPYSANGQNDTSNGIILRSDLHTLFDQNLLAIQHGTWKILCSTRLSEAYQQYHGKIARIPDNISDRPDPSALEERLYLFNVA